MAQNQKAAKNTAPIRLEINLDPLTLQLLLAGHELDSTPCGLHSAFARLPGTGGQILFLGCTLRPNTSLHAVEERIEPVYLYGDWIDYSIRFTDGRESRMRVRSHSFSGWIQRYDRIAGLLSEPALRHGRVGLAECFLVDAAPMWAAALEALRRDPLHFVEAVR